MVNSTVAPPEPPQEAKTERSKPRPGYAVVPAECAPPRIQIGTAAHQHELFSEALLEQSGTRPKNRVLDFFLSLALHTVLLGLALLIPLYFTEAIDLNAFTKTMLVAPPPPPPPPPAAPAVVARVTRVQRVMMQAGKLTAPTAIPQEVKVLKEEPLPADVASIGVAGGVPGGVPGGQVGGVIGGIISSSPRTQLPPPPPEPAQRAPLRVGGRVLAPTPVFTPDPIYPPLARQARISGEVNIDAVIDTEGSVVEMQVLSGHPLLIPAAMDALRKWKYRPTYLNDEPVPVRLVVVIKFRLA